MLDRIDNHTRMNKPRRAAGRAFLTQETMTMANKDVNWAELDRYGIERVPADVFLWGGYRYSSARDALAAAKRNEKP
jgi:hypothetical protein